MKDGQLDATLQSAGLGVASIRDLASSVPITVVPIPPEVTAKIGDPAYLSKPIPAGTYEGMDREVMTVAINNLLVTRDGVPADVDLQHDQGNVREPGGPHGRAFRREGNLARTRMRRARRRHCTPGAERFYRERGVLK